MKNSETPRHSKKNNFYESSANYYREIGEKAAMSIFTREKSSLKKLRSINPLYPQILSPTLKSILSPRSRSKLNPEKELAILQYTQTRDISHIKDHVSPTQARINDLPSDLEVIKRLTTANKFEINRIKINSRESEQGKKEVLIEEINKVPIDSKFSIEKMFVNLPSGRQECENLIKWLEKMKEIYGINDEFTENSNAIYTMCSNELIRQVSVNCNERGKLLQGVLSFYKNSCEMQDKIIKNLSSEKQQIEKKIWEYNEKIENLSRDKGLEIEESTRNLVEKLSKKNSKIMELRRKIEDQHLRIEEFKERFFVDNEYGGKLFTSLRRSTSLVKSTTNSPKLTIPNRKAKIESQTIKAAFKSHSRENRSLSSENDLIDNACQTDQFPLSIHTNVHSLFIDPETYRPKSINIITENYQKDDLKLLSVNINEIEKSKINLPDDKSPNSIKQASFDRKNSKLKSKKNPRKDNQKLTELEKKCNERQLELETIMQKIVKKSSELEFLSQTIDYKKQKEQIFNTTNSQENFIEKQLLRKPTFNKDFNILADDKFWASDFQIPDQKHKYSNKPASMKIENLGTISIIPGKSEGNTPNISSLTQNEDPKFEERNLWEPLSPLRLDEEKILNDEKIDEINISGQVFEKKSTLPLFNLVDLYDLNLYRSRRNPRKSQAEKILEKICVKDLDWIKSKATMSRKLIHKLILTQYLSFYAKDYISDSLLDFSYYDFHQRYGLKVVSDRKFIEFICSLILAETSKRCSNFLRFIGAGQEINKKNYSKQGFEVYLECLSTLMNSKSALALMDDPSERLMIPLNKATEIARERVEKIEKTQILRIVSILEYKAVQDPKKICINGIIDAEVALELIVEVVEGQKNKYLEGLQFILNTIRYKETKDLVLKYEISFALRAIYPSKFQEFEEYYEEITDLHLPELCVFCVDREIFSIGDIKNFYSDEGITESDAENIIMASIENLFEIAYEIDAGDEFMKTIPQHLWELKLKTLLKNIKSRSTYESIYAFKLFSLELNRIHDLFM